MGGIDTGIEIIVDAQVLEKKADEFTTAISTMNQAFLNLQSIMRNTSGYWEGEAAESCRRMFSESQDDIFQIIQRLKDHPQNLLQIAGVVQENERQLTEETVMLPTAPLD